VSRCFVGDHLHHHHGENLCGSPWGDTLSNTKNFRVALGSAAVVFTMLGLSYAAVPFYKAFCKATGFGGTTQRADAAPAKATDQFISIRFDANTSGALNWDFHPRQTEMTIKIGEQALAFFDAKNVGNRVLTGTAVFNVTPPAAGAYFNKIQCFCFTKQTLKPGEAKEFPVMYFVDPAMLADADAKGIHEITLSYTFYPADAPETSGKTAALITN
jgi:cytochrome c oxidase assembly protein subunit 11